MPDDPIMSMLLGKRGCLPLASQHMLITPFSYNALHYYDSFLRGAQITSPAGTSLQEGLAGPWFIWVLAVWAFSGTPVFSHPPKHV